MPELTDLVPHTAEPAVDPAAMKRALARAEHLLVVHTQVLAPGNDDS